MTHKNQVSYKEMRKNKKLDEFIDEKGEDTGKKRYSKWNADTTCQ